MRSSAFGRIDVWVNNAAVGLFSRFEDAPIVDFRRVIETDLFGYVYGARAVLPLFYRRGRGVLINVGSVMSEVPGPYVSAYAIAKHGVRALGECLRQEVQLAGADDIKICTVMPATIDTPFFQHAANYTGRAVKAMPPVYPADSVAKTIVDLVDHPRREVVVGNAGRLMTMQQSLAPGMSERMLATMVDRQHLEDASGAADLGQPLLAHGSRGKHRRRLALSQRGIEGPQAGDGVARGHPRGTYLAAALEGDGRQGGGSREWTHGTPASSRRRRPG